MAIVHRLFFALQPLAAAQTRIGSHRDGLDGVHGQVTNPRLHMTLAITRDYEHFPGPVAHALHRLGADVFAEPIVLSLERLSASKSSVALRPGRSPRELRALHKSLAEPMARDDLLRAGWRFNPHVTLAYRNEGKPFAWPIEPIGWESHEFVLIHSEAGATRHNPLGRWPLMWRQGRLF